jgi:hypothetical protein
VGTTYEAWHSLVNLPVCQSAQLLWVKTAVDGAFQRWNMTDLKAVVPEAANPSSYHITSHTSGNTELCRIYHLTAAASAPAMAFHCAHGEIIAAGQCGDVTANACGMIQQACGTRAFATPSDCTAYIQPLVTMNKTGNPANFMSNDDTLACRVLNAGMVLAKLDMDGSACNKIKGEGGCMMGPPKSAAASLAVSGLIALLPFAL